MGMYPNISGFNPAGMMALGMQMAERKDERKKEEATLALAVEKANREKRKEASELLYRHVGAFQDNPEQYPQAYAWAKSQGIDDLLTPPEEIQKLPKHRQKLYFAKLADPKHQTKPWEAKGMSQGDYEVEQAKRKKRGEKEVEAEFEKYEPVTLYKGDQEATARTSMQEKQLRDQGFGDVRARWKPDTGADGPNKEMAQIKLDAMTRFMSDEATQKDKQLLNLDNDPYLMRAAQFVQNDISTYGSSAEEKAQKTIELATTMRAAAEDVGKPKEEEPKKYAKPEDVKQAYKDGTISKEDAIKILQSEFGMK